MLPGASAGPPTSGTEAVAPALAYLARLAPGSRRTMRTALETLTWLALGEPAGDPKDTDRPDPTAVITAFPWQRLRYAHTQALRAALADRYAPATANKHLAALRGVLREAWRLGLLSGEDYHRAVDLTPVTGTTLPAGRDVTSGEIAALVRVCRADDSPAGARDGALLGTAFTAGLRVSELVALTLADLHPDTGALTIHGGKGRKDRTAYLVTGAAAAVHDWLAARGQAPGALFCPVHRSGAISIRALSTQAVYNRLQLRARQAGLKHTFSPHDGRRTWIGDLLDAGADLAIVQQLAGHASPTTTARYDRRPEDAKRRATARLHFPWS